MTPPPGADELVVRRVLRVPRERVCGTFRIVIVAKLDAVLARTDRLPP